MLLHVSAEQVKVRGPLHVGIDVASYGRLNRQRGVGMYIHGLLRGLAEIDRDNVYSLLAYESDLTLSAGLPSNFHWHYLRPRHRGRASAILSHQIALPLLSRRLAIDVLHCTYVPFNPSHPGPSIWQTVPTVVTLHDLTPLIYRERVLTNRRYRLYYRAMLLACRRARHLIADSQQTADDARRFGIVRDDRALTTVPLAQVLPTTTDRLETTGLADLQGQPFLLAVGGADYNKNQGGILDAYAILRERDGIKIPLVLVGGHHLDRAAAEARSPGLDAQIRRCVGLPARDLFWLYRHATALVFPSFYEGFGLPILEAMSQGCPVITSHSGATAEVAGDDALLVDPREPTTIATAVACLLRDASLRARLVERGKDRSRQFTWQRTAQATLAVYRDAAGV